MLDWAVDLAQSQWAYVISAVLVLIDSVVGVIPAEAVLHAAGVGAARDGTSVWLLIGIVWLSAVAADLLVHWIGRRWGTKLREKFTGNNWLWNREKSQHRIEQARDQLDERPWLMSVARFIPGMRTVTYYAAGSLDIRRPHFLAYEAPGALVWSAYNVLIGYFFGRVFQDQPFWVPFLVALGIATVLSVGFEAFRRARLAAS